VLVDRLAKLPEFYSAYTPYQAEASQGILQAFHEFQTMIARLLGCDIANASLYDGATALAEAAFMASELTKGRRRVVVSETVAPQHRAVLRTYLEAAEFELVTIPHRAGETDWDRVKEAMSDDTAALVAGNPNFFGILEDLRPAGEIAHRHGALLVATTEPILLGVLEPPGAMGADIVVADGVSLGLTPYAGGDALGLFACRQEYLRKVPGRLVGLTKDTEGRRAYTLTLQTREQHIRREKATSNICTNQGLHALRAAIYLALLGPQGLREVGLAILGAAVAARRAVERASDEWEVPFRAPTAQSFVLRCLEAECQIDPSRVGLPLEPHYPELKSHFLVTADELTDAKRVRRWVRFPAGAEDPLETRR
jgi:glycine dehydrogenase subunit 1